MLFIVGVLLSVAEADEFSEVMRPDAIDRERIGRAIFAETNRTRRSLGLRELQYSREADETASLQASMSAFRRVLGHENPGAGLATAMDRARRAGLRAAVVAENVAVTPLLDVGEGNQIGISHRGGGQVFVNPETGELAKNHTYRSFAANVVRRWMESPSHRRNIVNPDFDLLGCSAWPSKGASTTDVLYSVQVFAAKRPAQSLNSRIYRRQ